MKSINTLSTADVTSRLHSSVNNSNSRPYFGILLILCAIALAASVDNAFGADGLTTKVLAAGQANTVVLRNDGTVWALGYNGAGESGSSLLLTSITSPVQMSSTVSNATAVSCGGSGLSSGKVAAHTLILRNGGGGWA